MELSSLIIPRVEVFWGEYNLTSPSATPGLVSGWESETHGPLVYDVRATLEDQGQTPSGSMKWNTTGKGFEAYEKCLKELIDKSIVINFYFVSGSYIPLEFYWGGHTDTYGKDMEMSIKLVTLMDGLINANFYATAQADKEEKGKTHKDSVANLEKQYGIQDQNLIRYTKTAEKDTSKSIVKMAYNDGSTFMDAVQNLVKDNGNYVFFNNIEKANATVFAPYKWEGVDQSNKVIMGIDRTSKPQPPDPTKRYSYLIGPTIIQNMTRTYEWQPPQKSQEISSALGKKAEGKKKQAKPRKSGTKVTSPDKKQEDSAKAATATSGVHGSKQVTNIRSDNNGDGPKKQDLFTKERAAKLSLSIFLCPALIGIKPMDIILIPRYDMTFVEDWIVTSVEYQQTAGGVEVSIQATREFGLGEMMVPYTKELVDKVFAGSGGPTFNALEAWEKYSWSLPGTGATAPTTSAGASPAAGADKPASGFEASLPGLTNPLNNKVIDAIPKDLPAPVPALAPGSSPIA